MTITSIGSSFSYIRPEAAARETAAGSASSEASETSQSRSASAAPEAGEPSASHSAKRESGVTDMLQVALLRVQEQKSADPSPRAASRAYAGH